MRPRVRARLDGTNKSDQLEEAYDWLDSAEGEAAAKRAVERGGLPSTVLDDVRQLALIEVYEKIRRGHDIDNLPGFCTTVLRHKAIDMVRASRPRRDLEMLVDPMSTSVQLPAPSSVVASGDVDQARHRLFELAMEPIVGRAGGRDLRLVSAAFTFIAIVTDDAVVGPDCPTRGVQHGRRAAWAGFWYGGLRELVGSRDRPVDGSTRRRRDRTVDTLHQLLAEAGIAAGDAHHG